MSDKSNILFRTNNFPYDKKLPSTSEINTLSTENGRYEISFDSKTDNFSILLPNGDKITDNIKCLKDRRSLYEQLESGAVLSWINRIYKNMNKHLHRRGILDSNIEIDELNYKLRIDKKNKKAYLTIPEHIREMDEDNIYIMNMDLPLINDGILNDTIRLRLSNHSFQLPPTPYEVGLGIHPKITNG